MCEIKKAARKGSRVSSTCICVQVVQGPDAGSESWWTLIRSGPWLTH